jgi:ribosome biogenesis GTPase / thiamine phosphate phosphatase
MLPGLVIRSQSGFYTVFTDSGTLTCHLRGRLKQGPHTGDQVAVGDRVQVSLITDSKGMIEVVEPRLRLFSRLAPQPQGEYEQIIIANPDQVILVFACADPAPHLSMLDRFLVIAEKAGIPPIIVANKTDLMAAKEAQELFRDYAALGYSIIFTSIHSRAGIDELRDALHNQLSLFTGPSGVGKSSLLNAIQPGLGLAAREVSQATSKGKHTTVVRELFRLESGGWVADTPGLKALALWDIEPVELDGYFPEMRMRVQECQFNDCTHQHEPGCAVIRAVESGEISAARYLSYLHMRNGDQE